MAYLINAIPGAIVAPEGMILEITPVKPEWVPADVVSAIGHEPTARIVSALLGRTVAMNRVSTPVMRPGDVNYVALYQGPRLPEGATELPEGAAISFYRMSAIGNTVWPCFTGKDGGCSNCAGQHAAQYDMGGSEVYTCPCPHHGRRA